MVMTLSHDRIKKYLAKVTRQLEQFCSRGSQQRHICHLVWEIGSTALELLSASHRVTLDNGKYYFKEFYRWAEQNDDFLRWLDSLKNMWLESIIE